MFLKSQIKDDNKGFSLLELIVTVVILALVTAPLLSSFISASKTNARSKKIQEANELSQYVVENLKGTTISNLENTYGTSNVQKHQDGSTGKYYYTLNIKSPRLPEGFNKDYEVSAKLTPNTAVTTEKSAVPEIKDLNLKSCAVFCSNIYMYDGVTRYATADRRAVSISIDKTVNKSTGNEAYGVSLTVQYYNGSLFLGGKTTQWTYDDLPSVYVLYTAKSVYDTITIDNNTIDPTITNNPKADVYLIQQNVSQSVQPTNVKINGNTLLEWYTGSAGKNLVGIKLHTNISEGSKTSSADKNVSSTVETKIIDTLYDVDLTVNYNGKKISNFNASKINID